MTVWGGTRISQKIVKEAMGMCDDEQSEQDESELANEWWGGFMSGVGMTLVVAIVIGVIRVLTGPWA